MPQAMTEEQRGALAELRAVDPEAVEEAHRRGWLSVVSHRGKLAWRLGDVRNGCRRSLVGNPFRIGRQTCKAEAETKGEDWHRLIGLKDVIGHDRRDVLLVEGTPDLLAALHFAECEGRLSTVGVVVVLGEGARLRAEDLEQLRGRRVRIIADATSGGIAAAEGWAEAIAPFADEVQTLDLRGLMRVDGKPVKDLNDCTGISPDDFEENRDLWSITDLQSKGPRVRTIPKPLDLPLAHVSGSEGRNGLNNGALSYRDTEMQRNKETEDTERLRDKEGGSGKKEKRHASPGRDLPNIEALLVGTIPTAPGETNRLLFKLARRIKREKERGADVQALLEAVAPEWLKHSSPHAGDRTLEDVLTTLETKMSKVRSTGNLFLEVLETLDHSPPVVHPSLENRPKLERLARLCRGMGTQEEFILSTRQAAQAVGSNDASTGSDYLAILERCGLIECTSRGKPGGRKASRYRYTGPPLP